MYYFALSDDRPEANYFLTSSSVKSEVSIVLRNLIKN